MTKRLIFKEFLTEWNLSDFYDSIYDDKYRKDFLLLQQKSKEFIKKYSMKIHTFHTIEDFLLFYQDFEDLIKIFEKMRYAITFFQTKNIFDDNFLIEGQKIDNISIDITKAIEESFFLCDIGFFNFFENELSKNKDFPYKYVFYQDLKNYKRNNFLKDHSEINYINNKITLLENQYSLLVNNYYSGDILFDDFLNQVIGIFFELSSLRLRYSDIYKYPSIFEQKVEEYAINKKIFDIFNNSCKKFFKDFDFKKLSYKKDFFNLKITLNDSIVFLEKFFDFLNDSEIKKIFFDMIISGKIDFYPSSNKRNDNFTASIKDFGSYISLNFADNIEDILSIIHEFGHAYQAYKSTKQNYLEYQPSPFVTEICAIYFEKKLFDFCEKNILNGENLVISKILKNLIYKKFQDNIYFSFLITNIELDLYGNFQKYEKYEKEHIENILHKYNISYLDFVFTNHVFYGPFYVSSYVFSTIWAIYFSNDTNFGKFKKFCEFGGSADVVDIFEFLNIDIFDEDIYINSLKNIFYYKYE